VVLLCYLLLGGLCEVVVEVDVSAELIDWTTLVEAEQLIVLTQAFASKVLIWNLNVCFLELRRRAFYRWLYLFYWQSCHVWSNICLVHAYEDLQSKCMSFVVGGVCIDPALEYYHSLLLDSILEQLFRDSIVHVENLAIRILNSKFPRVTYFGGYKSTLEMCHST
jgi:hypothetical protein